MYSISARPERKQTVYTALQRLGDMARRGMCNAELMMRRALLFDKQNSRKRAAASGWHVPLVFGPASSPT